MNVEFRVGHAFRFENLEFHPTDGDLLKKGRRRHLHGILIPRERLLRFRLIPPVGLVNRVGEASGAPDPHVVRDIRDEARGDDRAVFVGDFRLADDVGVVELLRTGGQLQGRSEEEVADASGRIEAPDLRQNGERRVVEHEAPLGVVVALVVAAGPEGTHHLHSVERHEVGRHPSLYGLVDGLRRVAVVGGLLRLELLHEALVVLEGGFSRDGLPTDRRSHLFIEQIRCFRHKKKLTNNLEIILPIQDCLLTLQCNQERLPVNPPTGRPGGRTKRRYTMKTKVSISFKVWRVRFKIEIRF